MATIVNDRDVILQAASPRTITVTLPGFTVLDATTALANAATAQATANTAESNALAALADIGNISSDSVLSAGEKPRVVLDYAAILNEQAGIDSQATTFGATTKGTYDTKVTALTNYLNGLSPAYNSYTTDTAIVSSTFNTAFSDVYLAKQVLLNEIASIASGGTLIGTGVIGTSKIAAGGVTTSNIAASAATEFVFNSATGLSPPTYNSGTPVTSCTYINSSAADVQLVATGIGSLTNISTTSLPISSNIYMYRNVYFIGGGLESQTILNTYTKKSQSNNTYDTTYMEAAFSAPLNRTTVVSFYMAVSGSGGTAATGTLNNIILKLEVIKK